MPRRQRFNLTGVPQHIVQRGNNRQATFFADDDYSFYLECLRDAAEKYRCEVHAYVLMTNHVHLLMTPSVFDGISRVMQSIGRRYVQHVNYAYKRTGTLWEGRHKTSLVQSEIYLLTCYRYIELNPVRANMVQGPGDYRWSSYRHHALGVTNALVRDHERYFALGDTDAARQEAYRELFKYQIEPGVLKQIRDAGNYGIALGGDRFREEVEAALNRRIDVPKRGRPRKKVEEKLRTNAQ